MKAIKIIFGTLFGLATVAYLVQFVQVLAKATFSTRGIVDIFAAFFALAVGALFTIWSFQSALGKHVREEPEVEKTVDMSLAPNATVTWLSIILIPLTFWIPLFGPVIGWIGIRRARWVHMPDWIAFLLACFFFIGVAFTLAYLIAMCLPLFGRP